MFRPKFPDTPSWYGCFVRKNQENSTPTYMRTKNKTKERKIGHLILDDNLLMWNKIIENKYFLSSSGMGSLAYVHYISQNLRQKES